MGKMKEIFMEMVEHEYNGSHDAFIQDMAKQTCKEFVPWNQDTCLNCNNTTMERNETEARCLACGHEFVYVDGEILRFK